MFGFAGQNCSAGAGPGRGASEWRPADGQDRPRKRAGTAHTHAHIHTLNTFSLSVLTHVSDLLSMSTYSRVSVPFQPVNDIQISCCFVSHL